jgi:hypothetical protein
MLHERHRCYQRSFECSPGTGLLPEYGMALDGDALDIRLRQSLPYLVRARQLANGLNVAVGVAEI